MPHSPYSSASASASAGARAPSNPHIGPAALDDLLDIVVNRRLKKSWRVKVNFKTGERVLTIPEVLADPPPNVKDSLIRWAMLPMSRKGKRGAEFARHKKSLEETVRAYLESRGVPNERRSRVDPRLFEHQTKGFNYDLRDIFDAINRAYFQGAIKSYIRWGHDASRTSYQTTRIDRDGRPFSLITISGVYDSPHVPEFAIYGLVYHEMLHVAIPPRLVNGRRVVHGRDFKEAERRFPFYEQWIAWEKENMDRLIVNARRRLRRKKTAGR